MAIAAILPASASASACGYVMDSMSDFDRTELDCECTPSAWPLSTVFHMVRAPTCIGLNSHGGTVDLYNVIEYKLDNPEPDGSGGGEWQTINEDTWFPLVGSGGPPKWTVSQNDITAPGSYQITITLQHPCGPNPESCLGSPEDPENVVFQPRVFTLDLNICDSCDTHGTDSQTIVSPWFQSCLCTPDQLPPPLAHTETVVVRAPYCIDMACTTVPIDLYDVIEYIHLDPYGVPFGDWKKVSDKVWFEGIVSGGPQYWTLSPDTITEPGQHPISITMELPCDEEIFDCLESTNPPALSNVGFQVKTFSLTITARAAPTILSEQRTKGGLAEEASAPAVISLDRQNADEWLSDANAALLHYWFAFADGEDYVETGTCAGTIGMIKTWLYYMTAVWNLFDESGDPKEGTCATAIAQAEAHLEFLMNFAWGQSGCLLQMSNDAKTLADQQVDTIWVLHDDLSVPELEIAFYVNTYPLSPSSSCAVCAHPSWTIEVDAESYSWASTGDKNIFGVLPPSGPNPLCDHSNEIIFNFVQAFTYGSTPVRLYLCDTLVHTHNFQTEGEYEEDLIEELQDQLDDLHAEIQILRLANSDPATGLVRPLRDLFRDWHGYVNSDILLTGENQPFSCNFNETFRTDWANLDPKDLTNHWLDAFIYLDGKYRTAQVDLCEAAKTTAGTIESYFPERRIAPEYEKDEQFDAELAIDCPCVDDVVDYSEDEEED